MNEGILNSLFLYWWAVLRLNFKKYDRERNTQESLNDYNKILTETDTEAFFSETENDTFCPRPNFSKLKPIPFSET